MDSENRDCLWTIFMTVYKNKAELQLIGLEPWKIVLAKGSSHPGWIMHKMTCRDRDDSSSEHRWMSHQSLSHWSSTVHVLGVQILKKRGFFWDLSLTKNDYSYNRSFFNRYTFVNFTLNSASLVIYIELRVKFAYAFHIVHINIRLNILYILP